MCSGMTHGWGSGTIWGAEDWTQVDNVQGKHLTCYIIYLVPHEALLTGINISFFLNDKLFTIFYPLGLYLLELETFLAQKLVALPCSLHVCALQPLFSSRTEEARRGWSMKTFLLVPSSTRRWVPSCYHGLHKLGESCSQEVSPARHP